MSVRVHPTALVSADAQIGENVEIGAFAIVGPECVIGDGCVIAPRATLEQRATLAANVRVGSGSIVGGDPQDLKFDGEITHVEIGENTVLREYVTVNRGTAQSRKTVVGRDCLIMTYTHLAHDCRVGDHVIISNGSQIAGHVIIEDRVIISGLVAVHQFVKIGAHAFLAGGAIVQRDVPPYVMVAGNPAVPHMVNAEGLKRRGFDEDQVKNVRNAYRILYRSDLKLAEATEKLRVLGETQPEVKAFVDFVTSSTRSIVR
jgi:UDP-N-acetylglucosamine acyltransferase